MITQTLHEQFRRLFIQLLGNRCDLCGQAVLLYSGSIWCEECLQLMSVKTRCERCGAVLAKSEQHCGECLSHPIAWDRLYCISDYHSPLSEYVKKVKYSRQFWHIPALSELLAQRIEDPASLIISVPTHWKRLFWRGFNQSHYLAYYLIQHINSHYIADALIRTRHTRMQMELNRKTRLHNLKGAFQINATQQEVLRQASRVAIVDDVVTTGTTVGEMCHLLRDIGVKEIDIYCLCRASIKAS